MKKCRTDATCTMQKCRVVQSHTTMNFIFCRYGLLALITNPYDWFYLFNEKLIICLNAYHVKLCFVEYSL